ncbi:hypothetical protein [Nocardioides marmoribigeumensis]|uniref:DUF5134 domain-containing protein n=1 Tax=Nocardioides marmoribigeumensis TaxID=433649 RepID=A0ABU2BZ53_9ACTN|nr:hypothetical protein [Nocardioides marmoribigeumensis]MDR7363657.1 hypothetical protein [Nocardioides marmoribigeumensis]
MSPETRAGLGSIVVLLFEVLWWGGLVGVAGLLVTSLRARRAERRPVPIGPPRQPAPPGEQWPLRVAVALAAAAAVHLVMVLAHAADGPAHQAFFLLTGLGQLVLAVLVLLAPSRHLHTVLWSGVGLVALWAASRTVGVAGPREAVGSWDLCVVLWQGYTVVEALRRLPSPLPTTWRPAVPRAWTPETYGVAGLTGLVLAVLPWSGGHG